MTSKNTSPATPEQQVFNFQQNSQVRVFNRDGAAWFIAADICAVLKIQNTTQALSALDEDERSMLNIGRQGNANIVNESGLYTLILRCRGATKPGTLAHRFRKWVTSEVLPAIRKTGAYVMPAAKPMPAAPGSQLISEDNMMRLHNVVDAVVTIRLSGIRPSDSREARVRRRREYLRVWGEVHDQFHVRCYRQIPESRFEDAIEFCRTMVLGARMDSTLGSDMLALRDELDDARMATSRALIFMDTLAGDRGLYPHGAKIETRAITA